MDWHNIIVLMFSYGPFMNKEHNKRRDRKENLKFCHLLELVIHKIEQTYDYKIKISKSCLKAM